MKKPSQFVDNFLQISRFIALSTVGNRGQIGGIGFEDNLFQRKLCKEIPDGIFGIGN